METMFSVWLVPKCYKQGQSSSGVDIWQLSVDREFCMGGCDKRT
jgi:hypothetical protein